MVSIIKSTLFRPMNFATLGSHGVEVVEIDDLEVVLLLLVLSSPPPPHFASSACFTSLNFCPKCLFWQEF